MRRAWAGVCVVLLILLFGSTAGWLQFPDSARAETPSGGDALIRVDVNAPIETLGLPVYAHLLDVDGKEYILTLASPEQVAGKGLSRQVIDYTASPGTYLLALERGKGAREAARERFSILHDDGRRILVKGGPGTAEELAELGFDISALRSEPMILRAPLRSAAVSGPVVYDQRVADMMSQVQQADLYTETGNLSGENAVMIGGSPYTITTRNTSSGEPIQKATQYVYERLSAMGLTASYQSWSGGYFSGRNVIGAKTGMTKPDEIVLVTGHLDDMPSSGAAPGADDNGSAGAAVLVAAGILSSGTFERTLRFVFFTGEEQGLYGSDRYAYEAQQAGENIVAAHNMDMIAWSTGSSPAVLRLHTRLSGSPGYASDVAIAGAFTDVVSAYGLSSDLSPTVTADGESASDHYSFWYYGYPAILAMEDDYNDFNPYYHSTNDIRARLNMPYFTSFTKASVGTAAHLAIPADAPPTARTLRLLSAGTGIGTVTSSPAGIDCGSTCSASFAAGVSVTLAASASGGSAFAYWSGGCSGASPTCVVSMSSDVTVTAAFNLVDTKEYKLGVAKKKVSGGNGTVASGDGMIDCGSTCNTFYYSGTPVTLSAAPFEGSTFTGWSGACTGTAPCNLTMDKAKNVTAAFTGPQKLTVRKQKVNNGSGTVKSSPDGIDCDATCPSAFALFSFSTKATLTATPAPNSVFTGWSPASICSGTDTCEVTMDKAKTVTAKFTGPQVLTVRKTSVNKGTGSVTSVPDGISCGAACKAGFIYGSTVALTAKADDRSLFAGWSPASICSGIGVCEVTMDKAKSVTAKFIRE